MQTIHISATDFKNRISEVLNLVYYEKNTAIVERYGKTIAKVIPPDASWQKSFDVSSFLGKYFGVLPKFTDVAKFRKLPRRKFAL